MPTATLLKLKVPALLAVVVATIVPLLLTRLTEAAARGVGVAQGVVVQASTTPLTVYPVTTSTTGNVCGLTAAPPVPLAVIVRVPL